MWVRGGTCWFAVRESGAEGGEGEGSTCVCLRQHPDFDGSLLIHWILDYNSKNPSDDCPRPSCCHVYISRHNTSDGAWTPLRGGGRVSRGDCVIVIVVLFLVSEIHYIPPSHASLFVRIRGVTLGNKESRSSGVACGRGPRHGALE